MQSRKEIDLSKLKDGVTNRLLLTIFVIAITVLSVNAMTDTTVLGYSDTDEVDGDFAYKVNPDGNTATITGCINQQPEYGSPLIIPEKVAGLKVTAIGLAAFQDSGFSGDLFIPEGVVSIGDNAFYSCGFKGDLIIPDSVETIGDTAFYMNNFTGNLKIGNGVTSIGKSAFMDCDGFSGNLIIGNSVKSIGEDAFYGCRGLTGNLTIPNGVSSIGSRAFYQCVGFSGDLTIPDSVTTIEFASFAGCSGFAGDLKIGNSVTSIGELAFAECKGFKGNLILGNSIVLIGKGAFEECNGFTGNLIIPEKVTSIGKSAFSRCKNLSGDLTIPNGVTTIGDFAFLDCGFTGCLTAPSSVTSVGSMAFYGNKGIVKVVNNSNHIIQLDEFDPLSDKSWINISTKEVVKSIANGTAIREDYDTYSDPENWPTKYGEESRGDFKISYNHEIPFFGKAKPTHEFFGDITVSCDNVSYKVTKAKVNKKKHLIQITGLEEASKEIVKAIKKATKGSNGLPFNVTPYCVKDSDTVTTKFKGTEELKSVKIKIKNKDYKAKKDEYEYDPATKIISFKGNNLKGSYTVH